MLKISQDIPANITSTCWKPCTDDVSNTIRNKYFRVISMHDELMQLWCLLPLTFWLLQYRHHNARLMPLHISEAMNYMIRMILHRDHSVHAPSQWEKTLQYNVPSDCMQKMILLTSTLTVAQSAWCQNLDSMNIAMSITTAIYRTSKKKCNISQQLNCNRWWPKFS